MTGITALLIFAAWTLVLMFIYAGNRTAQILAMKKKANSWTRGQPTDEPAFFIRAQHAHMNCVENLPVFAAIMLAAVALGQTAVVDALAVYFIAARIAQSVTHLIGVTHWLVFIRANFFGVQVFLSFWWIYKLACSVATAV